MRIERATQNIGDVSPVKFVLAVRLSLRDQAFPTNWSKRASFIRKAWDINSTIAIFESAKLTAALFGIRNSFHNIQ
jgi:hypothetical protein